MLAVTVTCKRDTIKKSNSLKLYGMGLNCLGGLFHCLIFDWPLRKHEIRSCQNAISLLVLAHVIIPYLHPLVIVNY